MNNGYESGYRGGTHYLRDFASDLPPGKETDAFQRLQEEVKKGYCIGPFDRCPFPNRWCDKQAYIGQLFFRRKNKYTNDGKTRLISNRSYPEKRSFNDLINRHDCGYYLLHSVNLLTP